MIELTDLVSGDLDCPGGGLQVDVGFDDGSGEGVSNDGELQPDEIDDTRFVCHGDPGLDGADGAPGADGVNGADGADGADGVNGADGAPGANGNDGAPGVDGAPGTNGTNGTNGVDGAPGADGSPAVTRLTELPAGDERCPAGGQLIEVGADSNGDLALGDTEVQTSSAVCAPEDVILAEGDSCSVSNVGGARSSGSWAAGLLLFVGAAMRRRQRNKA